MFDRYYGRYSVIEWDARLSYDKVPTPAETYSPRLQEVATAAPAVIHYGGFEYTLAAGEQVCGTQTVLSEPAKR